MSDRMIGRKKAGISTSSNPSLVSPTTPTLANPTGGFAVTNHVPVQTTTQVGSDFQEAQSASEQLSEPDAIAEKLPGHDISRISLFSPQAKLSTQLETTHQPFTPEVVQRKCAACEQEEEELQRTTDATLIQRDQTSSLPPVPNYQLSPPSLLQPPDPASRYRLGMDMHLQLDPQLQAMAMQYIQQQLDPATVLPALNQIDLGVLPNQTSPNTLNPFATPTPPPASPVVPAGKGPETPRTATAGDLLSAIMAVPGIDRALTSLQTQASDRISQDWGRLRTGEQVAVVSTTVLIGAGALAGVLSDPNARQFALDKLNGKTIPVPGLKWLRLEMNTGGDNLMLGMHVDVGRLLPPSLGFGPSSPSAIGRPPQPEIQRFADVPQANSEPSIGQRIQQAASSGGSSLDKGVQQHLEQSLNTDLSGVKIHTNTEADRLNKSVNAIAFTSGQDIFFSAGSYNPSSSEGQHLIAHEVVHTVQQANGAVAGTATNAGVSISDPSDAFEQEAEQVADRVMRKPKEAMPAAGYANANQQSQPISLTHNFSNISILAKRQPNDAANLTDDNQQPAPLNAANSTDNPVNIPQITTEEKVDDTAVSPKIAPKTTPDEANSHAAPQAAAEVKPVAKSTPESNKGEAVSGAKDGQTMPSSGDIGTTPPPTPALDTSSSEGLLQSLANTPASAFSQSLTTAKAASAQIQNQEKATLETSFPEVDQPTGLPRKAGANKAPSVTLETGQVPQLKVTGGGNPTQNADIQHEVAQGPLPGSQVSTAASEPKDDEGGSWWNWLFNRVRNFLGSLPTSDPGLSTSAGPRERVDLSGEADPNQNLQYQQESDREVSSRKTQADAATTADFGENNIFPTVPTQKLRPNYKPTAAQGAKAGSALNPPAIPDDMRMSLDRDASPLLQGKVNEQLEEHRLNQAAYQKESQQARADGQRRIAEETEQTRLKQEGMRQQARTEVNAERQRWQDENLKIQEKYASQSDAKRLEIDRQIHEKVQTTEQQADQKFTEAETKADAARQQAEAQAAEKKREADNRPRSWWDRVKGAVSDVFDGIRSAVNAIFDGLRKIVKGIIDAAKAAVRILIDAARSAIVGLIKGFGEFVKGLVTVALFAFPETAAKARAWIDDKVDKSVEAVNAAAEALKRATDAILDAVGLALDTALSVVQASFNLMLDGLEFLAKLPFEAIEALAKLWEWLKEHSHFLEGAQKLYDDPNSVIEGIKAALGEKLAEVPGQAYASIDAEGQKLGGSAQKHIKGILRHLDKALEHLKNHWWEEVKKTGWNLLWPWPAVWKDLKEIWAQIKLGVASASKLEISNAIDCYLKMSQLMNGVLGNLYGWFFIGSVLIGAIIGAFFGGAGALPGALAGAAFAGEVGQGLVIALVATEGAVIAKSVYDLSAGENTPQQDEEDYSHIAGSTLTLAITGALMLIGELAAKLAKSIWEGAKNLFKGGEAPEVKVGGEVPEVKGETPEAKGETPEIKEEPTPTESKADTETPKSEGESQSSTEKQPTEAESSTKVEVDEPSLDGQREVQVTEDGGCRVCASPCDKIRRKYSEELEQRPDLEKRINDIEASVDSKSNKAKQYREIEQQLADLRKANRLADEPRRLRQEYAEELNDPANKVIKDKNIKERLDAAEKNTDPVEKQNELTQIQRDLTEARHSGKQGAYHGPKPDYTNPGHHDPSSPNFRGGGSMTTPLPEDAASVYKTAIPDEQGKNWYGQNADGEIYRYQPNGGNDPGVHWNGRENSPRGLEVPSYIRKRFAEINNK
ncbi:eCIS core domain-containing protein [Calothrix sp. NIES-2098]|uniref:eCIS core domain-containing protein n=1 Tax=Calothrix sp. NIES-2098 TaxID=1954171 RepID=UPI000B5F4676|nr:hypothetical protein NIES2098_06570 [Calothrix sp. NIES-2098]